jgi:hypothetical protein
MTMIGLLALMFLFGGLSGTSVGIALMTTQKLGRFTKKGKSNV